MRNIKITRTGNKMNIEIDLSKAGQASGSGKNEVIASTGGNVSVEGPGNFKLGLNLYKPIGG